MRDPGRFHAESCRWELASRSNWMSDDDRRVRINAANLCGQDSEPLADMLLWPERSGCALQCQYAVTSSGRNASHTLVAAEAVKRNGNGEMFEIELVEGWLQVPRYWGNRCLHDEEVEAAVYGMASNGELQMLSIPADHDSYDAPRPTESQVRCAAVVVQCATTEEARILARL